MIDKLHLTSPTLPSLEAINSLNTRYKVIERSSLNNLYLKTFIVVKDKEQLMYLQYDSLKTGVYPFSVQLNPCSWNFLTDLESDLSMITDIKKLRISRIDHCVDLPMSIDEVRKGLRVKYKQSSKTFKESTVSKHGFITGMYFGDRPETLCVYDKAYELSKKGRVGKLRIKRKENTGAWTRFELRQFHKKVNIEQFEQIRNLLNLNPFHNVQFFKISGSLSRSKKNEALEILFGYDGFSDTYAKLNRQNNIKRNFGLALNETNFSQELAEKYWENLGHYFY